MTSGEYQQHINSTINVVTVAACFYLSMVRFRKISCLGLKYALYCYVHNVT